MIKSEALCKVALKLKVGKFAYCLVGKIWSQQGEADRIAEG